MRCIIADDEYLVRFSILDMLKEITEESDIEFSTIEQAQDGAELLTLIGQVKPHLAFVDIRMPKLNGLEAIEEGKKLSPDTEWIILTGYAEFEYAKRAVSLGATDYLLKPASKDELKACIDRASEKRVKQRTLKRERLEHQLTGILYNTLEEEALPDAVFYCGELFMSPFHIADTIEYSEFREFKDRLRKLSDVKSSTDCILGTSNTDDGSLLLMYQAGSEEMLKEGITWYREQIEDVSKECIGYRMTGLSDSMTSCIEHLISFSRNPVGLFGYPLYGMITDVESEVFLKRMDGQQEFLGSLIDELKRIDSAPREFLSWVKKHREGLKLTLENTRFAEQFSLLLDREFPVSPDEFISELERYISEIEGDAQPKVSNRIVNRALYLIDDQYMEEIGLSQIADQLSVTPNYLSYEFHKELGKTFTQYITQLRLEKAKELLGRQMYTIREIASMVGYSSSKHFSKVFKQHMGVSPSEYGRE